MLTPDPHGHLGPAREAVALIQQALLGTGQNPTMVESSPTPMSGSRWFPSLVQEYPALGAYPSPPSGSRLNLTIIEETPTQIEEDEYDQWFPLALEQGNNDEEEEIGVLEHWPLHHSPLSVASSPAPPEPMSGTKDRPMLVEESPAPHYIMVEDSPAPQCIVVEESPVPISGIKDCPCLVVQSPEPTEDRAGNTSSEPMSGTKDRPSLVDDSPAMPKVNNLCWGGGNPVEGGSATLPINLVSPPTTTSPTEPKAPQPVNQRTTKPRPEEARTYAHNHQQQHPRHQTNHRAPSTTQSPAAPTPPAPPTPPSPRNPRGESPAPPSQTTSPAAHATYCTPSQTKPEGTSQRPAPNTGH